MHLTYEILPSDCEDKILAISDGHRKIYFFIDGEHITMLSNKTITEIYNSGISYEREMNFKSTLDNPGQGIMFVESQPIVW